MKVYPLIGAVGQANPYAFLIISSGLKSGLKMQNAKGTVGLRPAKSCLFRNSEILFSLSMMAVTFCWLMLCCCEWSWRAGAE